MPWSWCELQAAWRSNTWGLQGLHLPTPAVAHRPLADAWWHTHSHCPHAHPQLCTPQNVGFKLMPKLSHRNTRRYADEGRERALRAAADAASKATVPAPARSGRSADSGCPRRRK